MHHYGAIDAIIELKWCVIFFISVDKYTIYLFIMKYFRGMESAMEFRRINGINEMLSVFIKTLLG